MGSNPTFDPELFTGEVTRRVTSLRRPRRRTSTGSPLLNRAITGSYPTGSTFKPITALAALESGELRSRRSSTTAA